MDKKQLKMDNFGEEDTLNQATIIENHNDTNFLNENEIDFDEGEPKTYENKETATDSFLFHDYIEEKIRA